MRVEQELSLLDAISAMRAERAQLVLVEGEQGPIGLVTMEDLLERVLGQFDDETDTSSTPEQLRTSPQPRDDVRADPRRVPTPTPSRAHFPTPPRHRHA